MYVLDASVILKWFLEEEYSEVALEFRNKFISGNYNLALPDLIIYETANALRYERAFSPNTAFEAVTSLIDLGIDIIVPTPGLVKLALGIAYEKKVTAYDAIYIALAHELRYDFVTADEKLYRKVRDFRSTKLLNEITH